MDAASPAPAPVGAPSEPPSGMIGTDKPCLSCGYNLRGLSSAMQCPECGTPVERSLRGNVLEYASAEYRLDLERGALIVELGVVAKVLATLFPLGWAVVALITDLVRNGSAASFGTKSLGVGFELSVRVVDLAASAVSLMGWWLLSRPDAGILGPDQDLRSRRLLRVALITTAVMALCGLIMFFIPQLPKVIASTTGPVAIIKSSATTSTSLAIATVNVVAVLIFAAWVTQYFASMQYMRSLFARVPDAAREQDAKRMLWLGPLLYVFGCGIGMIFAMVLYVRLVDRLRKHLKAMREGTFVAPTVSPATGVVLQGAPGAPTPAAGPGYMPSAGRSGQA